jgi:hypothetical protein
MSSHSYSPLEIAKAFLAGIKNRDKASMRVLCHPEATACLIRDGKPIHITVAGILDRIDDGSSVEMDEVSYDEVEHTDGRFATVWTPYKFYEDGKVGFGTSAKSWFIMFADFRQLHHHGSNNFCLWKDSEKGWTITAVQDIATPEDGVTNFSIVGGHDKA